MKCTQHLNNAEHLRCLKGGRACRVVPGEGRRTDWSDSQNKIEAPGVQRGARIRNLARQVGTKKKNKTKRTWPFWPNNENTQGGFPHPFKKKKKKTKTKILVGCQAHKMFTIVNETANLICVDVTELVHKILWEHLNRIWEESILGQAPETQF